MRVILLFITLGLPMLLEVGAQPQASTSSQVAPGGNTYMAGGNVNLKQPVAADLLAAGGRIDIEAPVAADAVLVGGTVDVRALVGQDLRAAGGTVAVTGDVAADLVVAGGNVSIGDDVQVRGTAWLAGSDVMLAGDVAQGARIYGNRITLSGRVRGDAELMGEQIVFEPQAHIDGNLSYASQSPPVGLRSEQVAGTITQLPGEHWTHSSRAPQAAGWFSPVFLISVYAFGVLLHLLFPGATTGVARTLSEHPWRSLSLGCAVVFTVPPLAILSMITIIGLPLGMSLLLLYPLVLVVCSIKTVTN